MASTIAQFPRLSVVIPVYNGARTICALVDHILATLADRFDDVELILVNDGSSDDSDTVARELQRRHPNHVRYIQLARNYGEHNAVMCGLSHTTGDCVGIIDDDFQNPPEEIIPMVERLAEGYDVVYSRYGEKKHSWFRNLGSKFNDIMATYLLDKPANLYLSSFKVMNRFLVGALTRYKGPYPYIDALILQSTSAIGTQLVSHQARAVGESNYTLRNLIRLWLNMATSFSIVPLRVATFLGFTLSALGVVLALLFVYSRFAGGIFFHQDVPPGWASVIVMVTFFSGVQLSILGVVGEYLGRVFLTLNNAPQFTIREVVDRTESDKHGE
jgi:glycosyltransferase involved in cell wall biosynthesis